MTFVSTYCTDVFDSYGEASSTDVTLMGATDFLQYGGANVYVRNYLVCR